MIPARSAGVLALLFALTVQVSAAQTPGEPGTLLPVQDRTGDGEIARIVDQTLRVALGADFDLTAPDPLRDALRALRVRDAGATAPATLRAMADRLGTSWFFSPTIHRANSNPVELTLSGWAFHVEGSHLSWAGFRSASGTGSRRALRGQPYSSLDTLAMQLARELVDDFRLSMGQLAFTSSQKTVNSDHEGYLRNPLTLETIGTIAVVPFQSITDRRPMISGETISAVARAALFRSGVAVAHPGAIEAVLRRRGVYLRGSMDPIDRQAVGRVGGASFLFLGTVEVYEATGGVEPRPRVAFSARLVDVVEGRIAWMNGQDSTGWDRQKMYALRRTYDAGSLAESMMQSFVSEILDPKHKVTQ